MFEEYEAASPRARYERLKDREFALLRYRYLVESMVGDRADAIRRLSDHLCNVGDFTRAPASSRRRFHLSEPYGLLRHSVWVSDAYLELLRLHRIDMDPRSARLCSLWHDAAKSGIGGIAPGDDYQPRYLKTSEDERRRTGEDYKYNPEMLHLVLPVASLWLIGSFVPLTAKEAQIIVAHDSMYMPENRSYAHRMCPESVLLAQADESSLIYECEAA